MTLRHLTILIAVLVLGLAPARASAARSENVSSTHTALVAAYTALHSIVCNLAERGSAAAGARSALRRRMPSRGPGSPENEPEGRMAYELTGALWAVGYHADASIAQRFIRTVAPLRWTDGALTRRMHAFITGLREMIALQVPEPVRRSALVERERLSDGPAERVAIRPARGSDQCRNSLAGAGRQVRAGPPTERCSRA